MLFAIGTSLGWCPQARKRPSTDRPQNVVRRRLQKPTSNTSAARREAKRPQNVLLSKKGRSWTLVDGSSLTIREGVSASRRFHFWLPSALEADLMSYGPPRGLLLGPAIRVLARRSLELEGHRPAGVATHDSPAS